MPACRHAWLILIGTLATLLLAQAHAQAQPQSTPRQLIDRLGLDIRQLLEAPQPGRTPEDAERAVAAQLTARIAAQPGDAALTARDGHGRTPLMAAASDGYPLVVAALLADPGVRHEINAANADGETAWMLAQFAPSLTLAACQPGVLTLDRAVLLPPYLRRMSQLLQNQAAGPIAIIHALEDAGAEQDPEAAKRAWLARCPHATAEVRQALQQGQLTSVLITESVSRQVAFNKSAADPLSATPDRPAQDMKFIPASAKVMPTPDETSCRQMPKIELRAILPRSGEATFKAHASTRAGVVEVVDLTLTSLGKSRPPLERKFIEQFRQAILQALAGYQCEGELVFEQEFQFRIR